MSLRVFLGDVPVGRLARDDERNVVLFRFDEAYRTLSERPVLGRDFEDFDLTSGPVFLGEGGRPPLFFRNLLPEGALRTLIESEFPSTRFREFRMLERLGADLPGDIRIVTDQMDLEFDEPPAPPAAPASSGSLRFSLAGLQLKLSVLVGPDDRVTVPVSGQGGRWIAKLPSPRFPSLPENEHTMLAWAHAAGLDVPAHDLRALSAIDNLPAQYQPAGDRLLLVKRFDRDAGRRIHQEDFAQVFNVPPEAKFASELPDDVHYASIARVVRASCGDVDFREFLRRLAFVILSGNADAHVKNWALVYPERRRPRLSPVYDFVSTIAYPELSSYLALNLFEEPDPFAARALEPHNVTVDDFRRIADFAGADTDAVAADVAEFSRKARDAWVVLRAGPDIPECVRSAVDERLGQSRL